METKQIIIIRKDLKLSKEQMVEQGVHASMYCILNLGTFNPLATEQGKPFFCIPVNDVLNAWLTNKPKTTNISISVNSESELLAIAKKAKEDQVTHALIQDSGLTEFGGIPTYTSISLGSDMVMVRKDLNMRKGKIISQSAHASMAAVLNMGSLIHFNFLPNYSKKFFYIPLNDVLETWLTGKFKKIALSVNSEAELLALADKANEAGLTHALIQDKSLIYTALAIGPDMPEKIDPLTGTLPLL